jgi:hypothetical protein
MTAPALIVHTAGADTREAFQWTDDDGTVIVPTDAAFDVDDIDGDPVDVDEPTIDDDGTVRILIPSDADIDAGIYRYSVRAESTDWRYLSAGILRVRNG